MNVKEISRTADGVVVPESLDAPLTVVEFQFQLDSTVYQRTGPRRDGKNCRTRSGSLLQFAPLERAFYIRQENAGRGIHQLA
ncbi:MAG: DUF2887 domain-containing protein [Planctomycetes bacterium]|nr:DUF2887 domain-containing protein [Planctomycetota bacterium]